MNSTTTRYKMLASALLVSGLGWFGSATAATAELCAGEYVKLVGGVPVTMWGYSSGAPDTTTGACPDTLTNPLSSPGPEIVVPAGEGLTVLLHNTLSEPTSLIIPGQTTVMVPVFDGSVPPRVLSFTHETAPGALNLYDWPGIKSGTYAYQSGTHPAVQVQMGLYGAMTQDYASVAYDSAVTLLYSEIDPAMHTAIAGGDYGCPTCTFTSTVDYAPRYFLVNGEVFDGSNQNYDISAPGERTLVRFINMGLTMHAPTINGARVQVIAEDGNLYPDYRDQYSIRLTAGKTRDAIISVAGVVGDKYAVYDRMLSLSNNGVIGAGGMMSFLTVAGTPVDLPTAVDDSWVIDEEMILVVDSGTGVLFNDTTTNPVPSWTVSLVSGAANGNLTLGSDGSFNYTPDIDFFGTDSFVYAADDGIGSATATATITVTNVNDAPVAGNDSYAATVGEALVIAAPGVLLNDSDIDGDALAATLVSSTDPDLVLGLDGSISYLPTAAGIVTVLYTANDPSGEMATAMVTIDVTGSVNEPPVAWDDFASVTRFDSVTIMVLANDSDADDGLDVGSIVITQQPDTRRGSAVVSGNTIIFTSENLNNPNRRPRRGTATFTYTVNDISGQLSNEATVRVNVTR